MDSVLAPLPERPDHLRPGLRLVFAGTNRGRISAGRGHCFACTGNPCRLPTTTR